MVARRRTILLIGSLSVAAALFALAIVSLWVGVVIARDSARWAVNSAEGTQALHSTTLAVDLHRGRLNFTQTRTLSKIGPVGSVAIAPPTSDWEWFLFTAGSTHERSWDRRWFADRWDNWRLGDLGWYESAGGGSVSRILSIPLWMLVVPAGLPGVLMAMVSIRTARRRARGLCVRCGYRLDDSRQVCPECGRKAPETPTPPTPGSPARR